jgi:hypothetical protein
MKNGMLPSYFMANKQQATCVIAFIKAYWKWCDNALILRSTEE